MNDTLKAPRIVTIDALRGFSLAGVALAHMTEQYIGGPQPEGFMQDVNGLADQIVIGILQLLIVGKFFALFSILFGLSFSIQMDSAANRGEDFSFRFLWRASLLFVIGFAHQLFYRGDILTIYAMLAPLLIPFHRVPQKWLLIFGGLCFLSLPRFIAYAIQGNNSLFGLPNELQNPMEAAYFETLKSGSLPELMKANADYGMRSKMNFQLLFLGRFYYTFGYFLVGLWLGRIGLFRKIEEYAKTVRKVLKWSALGLIPAIALVAVTFGTAPQPIDFSSWHHVLGLNFADWMNLLLTSIIVCAFVLLYRKPSWERRLNFFAPYGRMALTNYLLQALIGTSLFFGWGLGLMEELRSLYLVVMALVLITLQTLFSRFWLSRFRYGPIEWLWRSGTYLKWQPLRK